MHLDKLIGVFHTDERGMLVQRRISIVARRGLPVCNAAAVLSWQRCLPVLRPSFIVAMSVALLTDRPTDRSID